MKTEVHIVHTSLQTQVIEDFLGCAFNHDTTKSSGSSMEK